MRGLLRGLGGWGWTFAGIICVPWGTEWARSGGLVFIFVLGGTCWGCLSRDGEGAGLLDGFVSRWPCGHDTVAHHVLSRRLS